MIADSGRDGTLLPRTLDIVSLSRLPIRVPLVDMCSLLEQLHHAHDVILFRGRVEVHELQASRGHDSAGSNVYCSSVETHRGIWREQHTTSQANKELCYLYLVSLGGDADISI